MFKDENVQRFASSLAYSLAEDGNALFRETLAMAVLQGEDLFVIVSEDESEECLVWSNFDGWVNDKFDVFSKKETEVVTLPLGGRWMLAKEAMLKLDTTDEFEMTP